MKHLLMQKVTTTSTYPNRSKPGDAGLDLFSDECLVTEIPPMGIAKISTGIRMEIPEGFVGKIESRSSYAEQGMIIIGGVIDSNYRGTIKVLVLNLTGGMLFIRHGDKIAQMLVLPYYVHNPHPAVQLQTSNRGLDGFGSTGNS